MQQCHHKSECRLHLFSSSRYLTLSKSSLNHPIGPAATLHSLQILPARLFLCDFVRSDALRVKFPNLFALFLNVQDLSSIEVFPIPQEIKHHSKMMIVVASLKAQIRSGSMPPPILRLPRDVKVHPPLLVEREIWATPITGPVQQDPDIPVLRMRRLHPPCRALSLQNLPTRGWILRPERDSDLQSTSGRELKHHNSAPLLQVAF